MISARSVLFAMGCRAFSARKGRTLTMAFLRFVTVVATALAVLVVAQPAEATPGTTYDAYVPGYDSDAALVPAQSVTPIDQRVPDRDTPALTIKSAADRGDRVAAKGGSAAASSVRAGGGASLGNITVGEAGRIQNAANRIGNPISLVGSRASGTSGAYSDWDYVITGVRSGTKHSVSSSLPRGATELGVGRQIDIFTGPLDDSLPHLTFSPKVG